MRFAWHGIRTASLIAIGFLCLADERPILAAEQLQALRQLADADVFEVKSLMTPELLYRGVVVGQEGNQMLYIQKLKLASKGVGSLVSTIDVIREPGGSNIWTGEGTGVRDLQWEVRGLGFINYVTERTKLSHPVRKQQCMVSVFDPWGGLTVTCRPFASAATSL